ncbi:MAG: carboxypeptidase M32, partial [Halobacteriales archaeon]
MATDAAGETPDAYEEFVERVKRISNVQAANGVLGWDQEVMMPEGGTPARSQQKSALSAMAHEELVDDETGTLLAELEDADLTRDQHAVVREMRRQYDRQTAVPTDLVEEISETTSEAHPVWKEARENDDFEQFAPTLEKLVDLKREYAAHIDPDRDPYEVL